MRTIGRRYCEFVICCGAIFALNLVFMGVVSAADDAAAMANLKARLAKVERDLGQLTEGGSKDVSETGIPLHGFADVGFTRSNNDETRLDQSGRGFSASSLDFYLTPQFSDSTKALIELIFEFAPDGSLATDLERLQFGHIFNDSLTVWMGRYHAPYGYWNTGFHHGAEIQTSILRPRFIDFEDKGGLLPSHVMGAWATGAMPMGKGKMAYDLYAGNGNAIDGASAVPGGYAGTLAINNARDSNGNKLVGANVGYQMGGMVVGAHGFTQRVNIRDAAAAELGEVSVRMTGLYGYYEDDSWEGIAEYYHFNNEDLTAVKMSHASWLAFSQVGHAVGERWMPYLRLERASLDQADPYFSSQEYGVSYARQAVGVRYSLNPKATLKLEVNRTKEGDGVPTSGPLNGSYSEARLQYAVRF